MDLKFNGIENLGQLFIISVILNCKLNHEVIIMNVTMGKAGRVVIPVTIREQLDLPEGTPLDLVVRDQVIELYDRRHQIKNVLDAFSKRLPSQCVSLAQAVIEERRQEAAGEAV